MLEQNFKSLFYATKNITLNNGNLILSNVPLSTEQAIKNFFSSLSIEYPLATTKKCSDFFDELKNKALLDLLSTKNSCIDNGAQYIQNRTKTLSLQGYSKEQDYEEIDFSDN